MTVNAPDLHYDPYDVELNLNPYPMFARLREEPPLYYNAAHDFYAVSRFDDVNKAVIDHETFISSRGALLGIIQSGMEISSGDNDFRGAPNPRNPPQPAKAASRRRRRRIWPKPPTWSRISASAS